MPAKLSAICFVHFHVDRLTQEFTVREVTGIVKLSDDDPNKIIYLNIKVFILVTATSIRVIDFDFETMPPLGINSIIVGITTQTAKNVGDDLALDFYMEERIGEKEPSSFWIEARHKANNRYLFNRTNTINQTSRSTTALLIGTITYQRDNETTSGKHVIILEDISMINLTRNNSDALSATPMVVPI
ncbi:hypothetical protein C2G38_2037041 [Gigaspora rosea]|uniref:Uncharacterized protein n=1 Tax=Gigaspora rosea TaxID=44941 RepID=A0A397V747_9GLOM|nr:hypothetical protein C2G38_2037041 [Gigaspora rosea]